MTDSVFSVQDDSGTVYQLTVLPSPSFTIAVGDRGLYDGIPDNGTDGTVVPDSISAAFAVSQVLDATHFSITSTPDTLLSGWPRAGTITWTSGANIGETTVISEIDAANAYITVSAAKKYLASRGRDLGTLTDAVLQAYIVNASDYIDQRYGFKGVKLVQKAGPVQNATIGNFIEPWSTPSAWAITGSTLLVASTTPQETQWPRRGVVDFSGDSVHGIPQAIKQACAELVFRQSTGTALQPDYDPNVITGGGVVASRMERVGPIERQVSYDTKLGLGYFPTIPQVTRILSKAGLLNSGGSRIVR
jgi:hypothetical protein